MQKGYLAYNSDKQNPAKKLYERVIQEQGTISPNSELAKEAEKYLSVKYSENSNYIKYIQQKN